MEQGWDPEVKKFFVKILNTIAVGLLWMMITLTLGLYFGLAYHSSSLVKILFYAGFLISLFFLIRYFYRRWK